MQQFMVKISLETIFQHQFTQREVKKICIAKDLYLLCHLNCEQQNEHGTKRIKYFNYKI